MNETMAPAPSAPANVSIHHAGGAPLGTGFINEQKGEAQMNDKRVAELEAEKAKVFANKKEFQKIYRSRGETMPMSELNWYDNRLAEIQTEINLLCGL